MEMINNNIPEEFEETVENKIQSKESEIEQMKKMIQENYNKIAEGDNIKNRERMIKILTIEIKDREKEIQQLKENE